jgi:hypothetical protein
MATKVATVVPKIDLLRKLITEEGHRLLVALPWLSALELQLVEPLAPMLSVTVCANGEPASLRSLLESGVQLESGWTPVEPLAVVLDAGFAWQLRDGTVISTGLALQEKVLWSRTGEYRLIRGHLKPVKDGLLKIETEGQTVWGRSSADYQAGRAVALVWKSYLAGYMPIVEVRHVWPE